MNILQTEWWTIGIPPEWWAEHEEDRVVIGDRDDVGCIEISTLRKDEGEFDQAEVGRIARENGEPAWSWHALTAGDFKGYSCSYTEEEDAVREWYLAAGPTLLFITYSCALDNGDLDVAAVDEILDTLALEPAAS